MNISLRPPSPGAVRTQRPSPGFLSTIIGKSRQFLPLEQGVEGLFFPPHNTCAAYVSTKLFFRKQWCESSLYRVLLKVPFTLVLKLKTAVSTQSWSSYKFLVFQPKYGTQWDLDLRYSILDLVVFDD